MQKCNGNPKIKGGKIITNLPNSGFNNGIHFTTQDDGNFSEIVQPLSIQGEMQYKSFPAEQAKSALSEKSNIEIAQTTQPTPLSFQKTLGNTLYTVSVHFSNTSRETFEDKILRMLERAVV